MTAKIGDTVTSETALELCKHYGFDYLIKRIEDQPELFKNWIFDGVSMAPDKLCSKVFRIPNLTEIALRHDLKYAYGEPHNKAEKAKADLELKQELLSDGASAAVANFMFLCVRLFGDSPIKTSFSWGFARK